MRCLGLDTSCYTTSAAICGEGEPVQARKLLPVPQGERGLRQSEAVFAHIRQLPEMVDSVMKAAGGPVDCVCASVSPRDGDESYMPVFEVSRAVGQSVASALCVPFFSTTHQRGHIAAVQYGSGLEDAEHFLALHLSGGTTDVLEMKGDELREIATSVDLHAGQLVDRIGVALGLPFPAGPYLEKLAVNGHASACVPVSFDGLNCHLSGAEAQLARMIKAGEKQEDIACEVYDLLTRTVLRLLSGAAEACGTKDVLLAGGVISSALLRKMLIHRNESRRLGLRLHFGRPEFSGDNAVGAALLGCRRMKQEEDAAYGCPAGRKGLV